LLRRLRAHLVPREIALGACAVTVPLATVLLASVPYRFALAQRALRLGAGRMEMLAAGLATDVHRVLLALAGVFFLASLRRKSRRAATAAMVVAFTVLWVVSVSAAEFRIQRGLYPTWYEAAQGLGDAAFVLSALPTLWLTRYLYPALVAWGLLLTVLVWPGRLGARVAPASSPGRAFGFTLAAAVLSVTAFQAQVYRRHIFPALAGLEVEQTPYQRLLATLGAPVDAKHGMRTLLANTEAPGDDVVAGARMLGFGDEAGRKLLAHGGGDGCKSHPLAQRLPPPDGAAAATTDASLGATLRALSTALFAGQERPVHVWHLTIESYRGDDVTALNPRVPRAITPRTNALYENAAADAPQVLAAAQMHQAGVRTAHGIAANLCGLGSAAFNLSIVRDLGTLALRCLPDVLADAGFGTQLYYGSDLAFDHMDVFFRFHGLSTFEEEQFPPGLPRGVWGVSDRALLDQALPPGAGAADAGRSRYTFLLTLSNHSPNRLPEDLDPAIERRIRAAVEPRAGDLAIDDVHRLETMAYSDAMVGEFLDRIEAREQDSNTIVVVGGDHSTGDRFLWDERGAAFRSGLQPNVAYSRIPFLVYFPKATLARASDPARARALLRRLNATLARTPLSQNDIPRLVLDLLAGTRPLQSLPEPWRWHTLGGERLAPAAVDAVPRAAVWGVDTFSDAFFLDAEGRHLPARFLVEPLSQTEATARRDPISPSAAFLGAFFRNYANACWQEGTIRAVANQPDDAAEVATDAAATRATAER
jgi:hypothetical protein